MNIVLLPALLLRGRGAQWRQVTPSLSVIISLFLSTKIFKTKFYMTYMSCCVSLVVLLGQGAECLKPLSVLLRQVYKCSPSSRTPSQKAVPAATGRSRTATCWRPWISTGTRTASSVPAVTAGWARWAPRSTPKPTSSCAGETTYGKRDCVFILSRYGSVCQCVQGGTVRLYSQEGVCFWPGTSF